MCVCVCVCVNLSVNNAKPVVKGRFLRLCIGCFSILLFGFFLFSKILNIFPKSICRLLRSNIFFLSVLNPDFTLSAKVCEENQIYQYNALTCQPSCTNRKPICTDRKEACVCKNGFFLSGKDCVPENRCGCYYNGIYLKVSCHSKSFSREKKAHSYFH